MRSLSCVTGLMLFLSLPFALQAETLEFGGRTRTYFVHAPQAYDHAKALPVMLVLHGGGQSAESAERMSGMSQLAEREKFLAVYPSGTSRNGHTPTWNSGACCSYAMQNSVDDIGFLRALILKLEQDYNVDRKRIFATGISNGGMLSFRAACELSDLVAAVAPVEGAQDIACKPAVPVSILIFHGTADRLVPFNGGSTPFQMGSKREDTPVADTVKFWVTTNRCTAEPQHEETSEVHIDRYSACSGRSEVMLYAIQGGHHMWPGLRMSGNHVQATEIMWKFFASHPKP